MILCIAGVLVDTSEPTSDGGDWITEGVIYKNRPGIGCAVGNHTPKKVIVEDPSTPGKNVVSVTPGKIYGFAEPDVDPMDFYAAVMDGLEDSESD